MEFTARRTGRRRYAVIARPERWPAVTMDPAPGFDARLPHDLVHYVVERELGIALGVFGQLALGGDLRSFRRLDGVPDRRSRRRGERLIRLHGDELGRSERLAGEAMRAWTTGARAGLEAVCAQLDELSARWSTLGIGGTLTVDWPEAATSGTLHPAGGSGRRAAHRPRRGRTPRRA